MHVIKFCLSAVALTLHSLILIRFFKVGFNFLQNKMYYCLWNDQKYQENAGFCYVRLNRWIPLTMSRTVVVMALFLKQKYPDEGYFLVYYNLISLLMHVLDVLVILHGIKALSGLFLRSLLNKYKLWNVILLSIQMPITVHWPWKEKASAVQQTFSSLTVMIRWLPARHSDRTSRA